MKIFPSFNKIFPSFNKMFASFNKMFFLILALVFALISIPFVNKYKESFVNLNPGSYPTSCEIPLLDDYPLKKGKNLSNNTAEDNSGYYPIFGSSLGQYTNNIRYWSTPNNGKCSPPDFCGALYNNKHTEIEKTPNSIPFSSKEIRVNYYGSHKLTCAN
jgi:hypothetical protein